MEEEYVEQKEDMIDRGLKKMMGDWTIDVEEKLNDML